MTAVVVGFGATFAESITFPVAMTLDKRHLPYVHRLQRAINQWFTGPALLVILATGFYQVSDRDWDMGDFWLSGYAHDRDRAQRDPRRLLHPGGPAAPGDGRAGHRAPRAPARSCSPRNTMRRSRSEGIVGALHRPC